MDNRAWTIIRDNPILLDFSDCRDIGEMHDGIKKAFGFPSYYGKNLDALWDCMGDYSCARVDDVLVEIRGTGRMPAGLRAYFHGIMTVLGDVHHEYPHINFILQS